MKPMDDYGPNTGHPLDPRNSPSEDDEWRGNTLEAIESAMDYLNKAAKHLNQSQELDKLFVTIAIDDAITELGGQPRQ